MKARIEYENRGDYLLVQVIGEMTLESGKALVEDIWLEAASQSLTRVLLSSWEFLPESREFSKFILGIHMAEIWGNVLKVAEVGQTEFRQKVIENAAVSSGAKFKVFSDEKQALQWLMKD